MTTSIEELLPTGWENWPSEKKAELLRKIQYDWSLWRRPEQWPPEDDSWDIFFYLAGRGAGKTRSGAEWVRWYADKHPGARIAVVAPTHGSVRDVCFEGDSGLLAVIPEEEVEKYNRSLGQIHLKNGSGIFGYSSGQPERLRGPQHNAAWYDELCAWDQMQATWDMASFGLRLGKHPQIFISTTPKPNDLIINLVKRSEDPNGRVILRRSSTFANAANLAESALREYKERYEGTALGRQELEAALIMDSAGALWRREWIDRTRKESSEIPQMSRIIVAVDPSAGYQPGGSTEDKVTSTGAVTGIIVAGLGVDGRGYVLEDCSVPNPTPDQWATAAVRAFHKWNADRIIYERNHGGAMAEHTLRTAWANAPLKHVYATNGKKVRAEPISALYEQNKISHVGTFPFLEDQMVMWEEGMRWSPDRMDALVWAFWELMLGGGAGDLWVPDASLLGYL